ncbi:MAG TPA: hypothetical protein VEZ49_06800, partial [Gemmatimonadales bacterium]|nr:hypothetical protein [Gemmatimonadales bacterium]
AGGATQRARIDRMRILRGDSSLWSGDQLQAAIARGATMDQLGMHAGDRIQIPGQRDPESNWRIAGLVVSIVATSIGIIALTHK